jgi:fido (protein-threonine AMPylation protein)
MTEPETTYEMQYEPGYKQRSSNWNIAIGLQQVDGLVPSRYLIDTANENIKGEISIDEARSRIESYYEAKPPKTEEEKGTEEADKVSERIAELLMADAFTLSPSELRQIHGHLFKDLYEFAGRYRNYNISKKEWVLEEKSVTYGSAMSIKEVLSYAFGEEKDFDFSTFNKEEIILHIAKFISEIWKVHPFGEGNTRTIAVFAIKYLKDFGFQIDNTPFKENSWYFRNALVRANYNDVESGIVATDEYLMKFFRSALLGEKNELKNKDLHI